MERRKRLYRLASTYIDLIRNSEHILFDLDGTLVDTGDSIIKSEVAAIKKYYGAEENIPLEARVKLLDEIFLSTLIGPSFKDILQQEFGLDAKTAESVYKYYTEFLKEYGKQDKLFEQVDMTLHKLLARGKKLYVATSKLTDNATQILKHFNIDHMFTAIMCRDSNGPGAKEMSKTEIIAKVIRDYNLPKDKTIMIGDTKHDMIGAENNGISFIWIDEGFGHRLMLATTDRPKFVAKGVGVLTVLPMRKCVKEILKRKREKLIHYAHENSSRPNSLLK